MAKLLSTAPISESAEPGAGKEKKHGMGVVSSAPGVGVAELGAGA
ncbi:hypothetical protein A2U01_0108116, partial [Trifolium medium]|nr:hypothetical protein [Trifolium medium]